MQTDSQVLFQLLVKYSERKFVENFCRKNSFHSWNGRRFHIFTLNRYKLVINKACGINEIFWEILIGNELVE